MKYYAVATAFYDDGKVVSSMTTVDGASELPKNTFKEYRTHDAYIDYFANEAEAKKFLADAKRA